MGLVDVVQREIQIADMCQQDIGFVGQTLKRVSILDDCTSKRLPLDVVDALAPMIRVRRECCHERRLERARLVQKCRRNREVIDVLAVSPDRGHRMNLVGMQNLAGDKKDAFLDVARVIDNAPGHQAGIDRSKRSGVKHDQPFKPERSDSF
jgi:hypothetical protein